MACLAKLIATFSFKSSDSLASGLWKWGRRKEEATLTHLFIPSTTTVRITWLSSMNWLLPVCRNVEHSSVRRGQKARAINRETVVQSSQGNLILQTARQCLVEMGAGLIKADEGEHGVGVARGTAEMMVYTPVKASLAKANHKSHSWAKLLVSQLRVPHKGLVLRACLISLSEVKARQLIGGWEEDGS